MREARPKTITLPRTLVLTVALLLIAAIVLAAEDSKPAPVAVKLSEYTVDMPKTLPPGPTVFQVTNGGRKIHSFKIEGPGLDKLLDKPIGPTETGTMEVTLQVGEYKVYCPVGSHSAKGMTLTLKVEAKAGG